uniref:Uncharacterized protein n=1 Tax=Knipowitschia caucasica TaxID=637954 RepID=A0AAV2LH87_KNICA
MVRKSLCLCFGEKACRKGRTCCLMEALRIGLWLKIRNTNPTLVGQISASKSLPCFATQAIEARTSAESWRASASLCVCVCLRASKSRARLAFGAAKGMLCVTSGDHVRRKERGPCCSPW